MKKSNLLRTLIGLVIAAFFVYIAFRGISFKSLLHDALRANIYILLLATLVVLASHFLRALRWRVILQELKSDISVVDTWGSVMVGYLFNNFVPRLGEIVRAYATGRLEEISVRGVLGTIVLERLFDMLSAGILFGVALFLYHGDLIASFPFLRVAGVILVAGSVVLGAVLYVSSISEKFQRTILRLAEAVLPRKIAKKAENIFLSFLTSFKLLGSGKRVAIVTFYTALIWVAYIYTMYIPFFAFGFGARLHLTLYDAFLLILITSIAWSVPSPGGTGVYHLFVSAALVAISGVPK
ncbi:MAG TPA: lysylphosphatidylglycerol synthase transmembrane domain-containing protein, partial [Candidatus Kryptobacter bacterium]